jgi:hypothetical protein
MDYTSLIGDKATEGSIKSWVNYANIPVTSILTEAQAEIYRHLRVREMRTSALVTIASGNITAALPTGYLDPLKLTHRNSGIPFVHKTQEDLDEVRTWDEAAANWEQGLPSSYSVYNEVLNFDMRADAAYPCVFHFYKTPTALSGANLTNWLTTRYPRLLRVACLRAANEYMENLDKVDRYDRQTKEIIQEINVLDDLSLTGVDAHQEYRRG